MPDHGSPQALEETLAAARGGDVAAFGALVRLHEKSVYSVAVRMLNQASTAEDIAQETFLQLYRRLDKIESVAHLRHWLLRVATNFALGHLRRVAPIRIDAVAELADEATEREEDPALMRRLRAAVARLPPTPRAVVVLRYQEDLDLAEIAELLDIPINTVKSHIRRSLIVLREGLPEFLAGEPQADTHD